MRVIEIVSLVRRLLGSDFGRSSEPLSFVTYLIFLLIISPRKSRFVRRRRPDDPLCRSAAANSFGDNNAIMETLEVSIWKYNFALCWTPSVSWYIV